MDICLVSVVCC